LSKGREPDLEKGRDVGRESVRKHKKWRPRIFFAKKLGGDKTIKGGGRLGRRKRNRKREPPNHDRHFFSRTLTKQIVLQSDKRNLKNTLRKKQAGPAPKALTGQEGRGEIPSILFQRRGQKEGRKRAKA